MSRYFFHRTDGGFMPDNEGTELADIQAARTEAVIFAGEMLRDHPEWAWGGQDFRVEVTDEGGMLLFTVVVLAIDAPAVRGGDVKPSRPT